MHGEPIEIEDIRELLRHFDSSGWQELRVLIGDTEVHIARCGPDERSEVEDSAAAAAPGTTPSRSGPLPLAPLQPPVALPAGNEDQRQADPPRPRRERTTAEPVEPAEPVPGTLVVRSPSIGIFWRSPHPGAPPFVEVGDVVAPDTTLCLVEVMKLFSHVSAGVTGVVKAILAVNGDSLHLGQTIFSIEPIPEEEMDGHVVGAVAP